MSIQYFNRLNEIDSFRLVIMGKDPFPTNPTGIPFCKATWEEQLNTQSSGFHVLNSIGINLEVVETQFPSPRDLFFHLASERIAFLNLSYVYIGDKIRRRRHHNQLQNAFRINRPIMARSTTVILCGEAEKNRWNLFEHSDLRSIVHPDERNRISEHQEVKEEWIHFWSRNSLKNILSL